MKILMVYPNAPTTFWSLENTLKFISRKAVQPPLGLLTIASSSVVTAVDMADRSDVVLSHVVVDGSRPLYGHRGGEALIRAGGSVSGQVVRAVKAFEPRTWSILHLFEGGEPRCSGAMVENNEFGPAACLRDSGCCASLRSLWTER